MIDLFQKIDFTSHAGLDLTWKIEMDALTPDEWECIAHMIMEHSVPFKEAIGIPRGGMMLGKILNRYGTGSIDHPICIVDDVLTTGGSMNEFYRKRHWRNPTQYIGWVVFSRNKPPDWVNTLFQMPITDI